MERKVPSNPTEAELLIAVKKCTDILAVKHKFAYMTEEDIKQEAFIAALMALPKYEPGRSGTLSGFLYRVINNHLLNLRRKKYEKLSKPCISCPLYDPKLKCSQNECEGFEDKMECKPYRKWVENNNKKKNVACPMNISQVSEDDNNESCLGFEDDAHQALEKKEILEYIDARIPANMRKDYIRFKDGIQVPRHRKKMIQDLVAEILEEYGRE